MSQNKLQTLCDNHYNNMFNTVNRQGEGGLQTQAAKVENSEF